MSEREVKALESIAQSLGRIADLLQPTYVVSPPPSRHHAIGCACDACRWH